MSRTLLAVLLGAGLTAAAVAQDKPKGKPKALPRIAIDDPAKAKADPDFTVQGEYEGDAKTSEVADKVGIQVVSEGEGRFRAVAYRGGLPGAGWNGKRPDPVPAVRENGKVVIKDEKGAILGYITDGTITLAAPASGTLKKVERRSPTLRVKPPEGAVVLFGGPDDVAKWDRGRLAELSDGKFLSVRGKGGDIRTKQAFGSFTAHVEFRLAWMPNSRGQGRSNSGVYAQDRYEIQVLDSFGLSGENNECGGIYTQHKPLVNMCYPPVQWQTFDIEFTAARYDRLSALAAVLGSPAYNTTFTLPQFEGNKKTTNARLTVRHNGVVIHDNVELPKECPGGRPEDPSPGALRLQDHGDPVVYRNVWVVEK